MFRVSDLPDELMAVVGHVSQTSTPTQGMTSDVMIVQGRHGRFVVKRSVGTQWSAWLAREHTVLLTLVGTGVPIPTPLAFGERSLDTGPESWLLMEWRAGETVGTRLERERDRAARDQIVQAWARGLAALHAMPPIPSLASPESWLDERLRQARYNLEHYPCDGDAMLLSRLERDRPTPEPSVLIHGDFTVDNTLIDDTHLTAMIDWAGGAMGDPRYDLALATEVKPPEFDAHDLAVFFDAYGRVPLSDDERRYFEDLYEFF